MDYNAPYGSADPNAGYIDRNTPGAISGSRVPAAAIELPQREIVTVIKNAGLTPTNEDPTQLDQAIDKKIEMITGGGGDANYVLMTQARVRLPIFPEVLTADGMLPVVSPSAGQVRVPAGYEFLHRGIFLVTTAQADFATAASKTYHLRWTPTGGFALKDLADAAYNPTALSDAAIAFDSSYDNMLVARIVTNSSNVPTITNLINKARLDYCGGVTATNYQAPSTNMSRGDISAPLDWARTPKQKSFTLTGLQVIEGAAHVDWDVVMYPLGGYPSASPIFEIPATRYNIAYTMIYDFSTGFNHNLTAGA